MWGPTPVVDRTGGSTGSHLCRGPCPMDQPFARISVTEFVFLVPLLLNVRTPFFFVAPGTLGAQSGRM